MNLASVVDATMDILSENSGVIEAAGVDRIFGGEVPKDVIASMPVSCVVVRPAGTPAVSPGTNDNLRASVKRVDVFCYAESPYLVDRLQLAVVYAMKRWRYGRTSGGALVHHCKLDSGPVLLNDPDGDWPCQIVSFRVQLCDELVAS